MKDIEPHSIQVKLRPKNVCVVKTNFWVQGCICMICPMDDGNTPLVDEHSANSLTDLRKENRQPDPVP